MFYHNFNIHFFLLVFMCNVVYIGWQDVIWYLPYGQCCGRHIVGQRIESELWEVVRSYFQRQSARRHVMQPAPLPGIERSRNLKILGVDNGHDFSVTQHVQRLASGDLRANDVCAACYGRRDSTTRHCSTSPSDCRYCENDLRCQCLAWIH